MATALAMFDEGLRRMRLDNFFLNAGHFHGVVFFVLFFIKSAAVMFQRSVLLYVQLICKCDVVTWQVVHNSRAKGVTHYIDACAETIPMETKLMRLTIHIQTAFHFILLLRIALYCQFFMLIRYCCRRLPFNHKSLCWTNYVHQQHRGWFAGPLLKHLATGRRWLICRWIILYFLFYLRTFQKENKLLLSILRHFVFSTFGCFRKYWRSITFLVFLKSLEIRAMYLNYVDLGIQNIL